MLLEITTRKVVPAFNRSARAGETVVMSPDSRSIVAAQDDGSVLLLDAASATAVCSLFSFGDGTWAVVSAPVPP